MSTVIYPSPIFGPVHSRRLGVSLGINLMPADGKICTFDCIYCECGFNADHRPRLHRPTREEVREKLEQQLVKMVGEGRLPDVLTFAGNGEPTAHPDFKAIIEDTIQLRNRHCPEARVSVLSNATLAAKPSVREALLMVDNNILKLDTVNAEYIRRVNAPTGHYDVGEVVGPRACHPVGRDVLADGNASSLRQLRLRFLASVVPSAEQFVERSGAIGVVHLKMLVVQVVCVGMGIYQSILAGFDLVEADMAHDCARAGDLQSVEEQQRMRWQDDVNERIRPVEQMLYGMH